MTGTSSSPLKSIAGPSASSGSFLARGRLRLLIILLFAPILWGLLWLAGTLWLGAFVRSLEVSDMWILVCLVTLVFYPVSHVFFNANRDRLRVSDSEAVSARLFSLALGLLLALATAQSVRRPEYSGPVLFMSVACSLAAVGPTPQVVAIILMTQGAARLLVSVFPWLWSLIDTGGPSFKFILGIAMYMSGVPAWYYPAWFGWHTLMGAAAIWVGCGVALRRPWARRLGIAICIVGILGDSAYLYTTFYNGYGFEWRPDLQPTRVPISVQYYLVYTVIFAVALFYLIVGRRADLVWEPPRPFDPQPSSVPPPSVQSTIPNDDRWHDALISSLQTTGAQRAPENIGSRIAGTIIGLVVLQLAIFALKSVTLPPTLRIDLQILGQALLFVISAFVLGRGVSLLQHHLRQLRARNAEKELARDKSRHPIFYLRSFNLEQWNPPSIRSLLLGQGATAEEKLVGVVRRAGPVIAIGRPDEQLPRLGAARFYVTNDLWRQKVADVVQVSQLVVWTTGVTEGLRWEISHLLRSVPIDRLILWAHPHLLGVDERSREEEWSRFHAELGGMFPTTLPGTLGKTQFIYFDADGTPHAVAPRFRLWDWLLRPWRGPLVVALRACLKAKGVPPFGKAPTIAAKPSNTTAS